MHNVQALTQKLEAREQLTFADFEGLLAMLREARADGRLQIREVSKILQEVFRIFDEFVNNQPSTGGGFGFDK
jgi:hypothetical protein